VLADERNRPPELPAVHGRHRPDPGADEEFPQEDRQTKNQGRRHGVFAKTSLQVPTQRQKQGK